jgi:hypothetical protein
MAVGRHEWPIDNHFAVTYTLTLCIRPITTLARPAMPRKATATEPQGKPVEGTKEQPRGTKTAAIRAALKANPKKGPAELAELLKAEGWNVKAQQISVVKSYMKAQKRKKIAAPAAAPETAPAVPKDAVSVSLLIKAKKLAAQFSSIKEAREALAALSQLMD